MARIATLTLTGISGTKYQFNVYPLGTNFKATGAVYAITKRTVKPDDGGSHDEIYVGQTHDISERFDNHHKADCFTRYNANCVCIHQDDNENSRLAKENDLIQAYDLPCND